MKKFLAVFMALTLAFCMAACGGAKDDEKSSEEPVFKSGSVEGNTFSSSFLGASVSLGDDWIFADDSQLADLAGETADSLKDENVQKALESGSVVYDMYALNLENNASLNITIEDLKATGNAKISEDTYADASLKQLPDALAGAGLNIEKIEKTSLDLAGEKHPALTIELTTEGVSVYETIVIVKRGTYIYSITAASYDNAQETADILAAFEAL